MSLSWLLTFNFIPSDIMFFIFQCKNVICKLQRRIDKEGCQLIPMLYDLWKKNDFSNSTSKISRTSNPFNLWIIDQRVEGLEYAEVADFITDLQSMLKNVVQFYKHSQQVCHRPFTSIVPKLLYNNYAIRSKSCQCTTATLSPWFFVN